MPTLSEHQEQQALLQQLRAGNDPELLQQADALERFYHVLEKAGLADDVYDAAKGIGQPWAGWARGSEHPDLLRQYAPSLNMSTTELVEYLHPDDSGFRAEIYIPDPAVLGPGYKPTLAFKGSSGDVLDAKERDGKRDTTAEDFVANNFPQSVGLQTDYYDRGMRLATTFKEVKGFEFELAAHSLGGSVASAASAVTGVPATTFNAAGLHSNTARRFAQQNGLDVKDVNTTVTAYQVQGELLNDGIQNNIHRLDAYRRLQMGGILQETGQVLNDLPEGRAVLKYGLDKAMPANTHDAVHTFIDKLANDNTAQLLHELPLAAGKVEPLLIPMASQNGVIVDRARIASLQEVSSFAGPVLTTVHTMSLGAHAGRRGGEVVAAGGRIAGQALDTTGDVARNAAESVADVSSAVTQTLGAAVRTGLHTTGSAAAKTRQVAGEVEATIDQLQGQMQASSASLGADVLRGVGSLLPDALQERLDTQADRLEQAGQQALRRNQGEATQARQAGQQDAAVILDTTDIVTLETVQVTGRASQMQQDIIAGVGQRADQVLDAVGRGTEGVTRTAPAEGALAGATLAGAAAVSAQYTPTDLSNTPNLVKAGVFGTQVKGSLAEAVERHSMTDAVIPSLEARIDQLEGEARQLLQQRGPRMGGPGGGTKPQARDDEALDRPAPSQAQAFPTDHHDYALFLAIQQQLPKGTPDDKTAEVMHGFKRIGIERADQFDHVTIDNDRAWVYGKTIGYSSQTSLSTPAPRLQDTLQQTQSLDQQRVQEQAQFRTEQEEINRNPTGPVMKMTQNGPATPPPPPNFSGPAGGGGGDGGG